MNSCFIRRIAGLSFPIYIAATEKALVWVGLRPPKFACISGAAAINSMILDSAEIQLREYFCGHRKKFNIPIAASGTDFQLKVWRELLKIPYGETISYSEIAANIENVRAARAVGMACNRNPIMIIIPCHRVVGKNGSLVGFAGGVRIKEYLLELEKASTIKNYEE